MSFEMLRLEGRLDTAEVGVIELAFSARAGSLNSSQDAAIFDLRHCTYISSMGIRLLITTMKQFQRRGVRFMSLKPNSSLVLDTIIFANLFDILNFAESEEEARTLLSVNP